LVSSTRSVSADGETVRWRLSMIVGSVDSVAIPVTAETTVTAEAPSRC
jgi:hypothetical protein